MSITTTKIETTKVFTIPKGHTIQRESFSKAYLAPHVLNIVLIGYGCRYYFSELSFKLIFLFWFLRMFAHSVGAHRYFSHRSFETGRLFQFIMGYLASGGGFTPLWYAVTHTIHHRWSDTKYDISSPSANDSLLYGYIGWLFYMDDDKVEKLRYKIAPHLMKYPELVMVDDYYLVIIYGELIGIWYFFGAATAISCIAFPFVLSTLCIGIINGHAHVENPIEQRPYLDQMAPKSGTARNVNWILSILSFGEGNHNNHHAQVKAANHGWFWYQPDPGFWCIWTLEKLGIVWNVKRINTKYLKKRDFTNAKKNH